MSNTMKVTLKVGETYEVRGKGGKVVHFKFVEAKSGKPTLEIDGVQSEQDSILNLISPDELQGIFAIDAPTHKTRELLINAIGRVALSFIGVAALFLAAFVWEVATADKIVTALEPAFSKAMLILAFAATIVVGFIAFAASSGADPEGANKRRAKAFVYEYIDEVASLYATAGGISLIMLVTGKGPGFAF